MNNETIDFSDLEKEELIDDKDFNEYSSYYMKFLKDNKGRFDSEFENICQNIMFICDKEYKSNQILIVKYDNGISHLIDADNNKQDLITKESLSGKKKRICYFNESSVFYELYKQGLIKDNKILLNINLQQIVNDWDGERHNKTLDLAAQKYAKEQYELKRKRTI